MTEFEALAALPPKVRKAVVFFCTIRSVSYKDVINADRKNIWDMSKVNGLITYLAALNFPLKDIHMAANTDMHYASKVIARWRSEKQFPIRTTNYERAAAW